MNIKHRYLVGNWKMNGSRAMCASWKDEFSQEHQRILTKHANLASRLKVVICPPSPYLTSFTMAPVTGLELGSQHIHTDPHGAYTGDVSAPMLAELGSQYVLVGHSERRQAYQESSEETRNRATAALKEGMRPVICIGEDWATRQSGQHEEYVRDQALASLPKDGASKVWLAYEPVWAIGQGRTPTSDEVRSMVDVLRQHLPDVPVILYGGSVGPDNAAALIDGSGVDGFLVGGASLKAKQFLSIGEALVS